MLLHEYYPYDERNMDYWYKCKKEFIPALLSNRMDDAEICMITLEDINDEE